MNKFKNLNQRRNICNTLPLLSGFLFWFLSFSAIPALADTPQLVQTQQTQDHVVRSLPTQDSLKDQAKMWGLTTEEFKRYLWLMKNTPSAHWYKDLDPAEVLALNAKDPNDMMQYAKIQARNMHARVTRELAFNRIYSKAYKKLYPYEKPIMTPGSMNLRSHALQAGDRVWLFVGINTPLGRFAYQHLIKAIQATPDTVLDIYFVGKQVNQKSIETWAANIGIPPNIVNKKVTLNYGNERFENVSKGEKFNLPLVGVVHNAHFQPITLSSVL